jgi:hypothetical protein
MLNVYVLHLKNLLAQARLEKTAFWNTEFWNDWGTPMIAGAAAAISAFVVVLWLSRVRRRATAASADTSELTVQVGSLPATGPRSDGPRLEFYGVPVRLAVLVLAPVGRDGALPEDPLLPRLVDQLLPQLRSVLDHDQPLFRRWPAQLSSQGFFHAFFHHLALPGDRGKNSPWCSVAGKFTAQGQQYLVGMVCCADRPNALSEVVVEHEGRWLDTVRVKA